MLPVLFRYRHTFRWQSKRSTNALNYNETDPEQSLRGGGIVMGKDNNDNWWIDWYIRKELWPALERKITALAV